ncbi:MAG: hypothetical protein GY756_23640 [bacterium]|nr:hypothetical protein [bacterium]
MLLAESLIKLMDKALDSLKIDPDHNLTLGYRRAIWNELGSKLILKKSPADRTMPPDWQVIILSLWILEV